MPFSLATVLCYQLYQILVGILRHYVVLLLQSQPKKLTRAAVREQYVFSLLVINFIYTSSVRRQRTRRYRQCSTSRFPSIFQDAFEAGVYLKDGPTREGEAPSSPPNPITDPAAMDGMMAGMKTQMVMMVPQMVIMGWINFFFQGFVLIKLPFPLTLGFKSMLQRGIETPDMDVRWVSSLSWYFLNFFGLNGLYRILLGSDNAAQDASQTMMASPFATAGAGQPGPQDFNKLFKGEKDNLAFSSGLYAWVGDDVEDRVLRKYGKL
ncbi:transmembrane protein [Armillaria mellea]|nr:transmembrane protein [Armillaria mellea]